MRLGAVVFACGLLAVGGCSGASSAGGHARIETSPVGRLAAIATLDQRVTEVFHRLVTANVDVCPHRSLATGWSLHAANQYVGELRDILLVEGLEGDLPAVSAVAKDSPAARAGLGRGDVILAVGGSPLAVGRQSGRPQYEGLRANLDRIESAVAGGGRVELRVRRAGVERQVMVQPVAACAYTVHLDVSDELNARADGRAVHISTALARFAQSEDDLALILAHELAHNVLRHRDSLDRQAPARRVFGNLAVAPGRLAAVEREADRVGLYLMARAGFAVAGAPAFWRAFGAANWRVRWAQWGYPSAEARARQLEAVVAEISAKQASGADLRLD